MTKKKMKLFFCFHFNVVENLTLTRMQQNSRADYANRHDNSRVSPLVVDCCISKYSQSKYFHFDLLMHSNSHLEMIK